LYFVTVLDAPEGGGQWKISRMNAMPGVTEDDELRPLLYSGNGMGEANIA
jgi:hypothetical protein